MASCIRNIRTKNYQHLIIGFQVTIENVGDVFFETPCSNYCVAVRFMGRITRLARPSVCLFVCRLAWALNSRTKGHIQNQNWSEGSKKQTAKILCRNFR